MLTTDMFDDPFCGWSSQVTGALGGRVPTVSPGLPGQTIGTAGRGHML